MKAIWYGKISADSSETKKVEGNAYFLPHAVSQRIQIARGKEPHPIITLKWMES